MYVLNFYVCIKFMYVLNYLLFLISRFQSNHKIKKDIEIMI